MPKRERKIVGQFYCIKSTECQILGHFKCYQKGDEETTYTQSLN